PAANFNGSASFTYTVTDGTFTSAPATVTVTVTPVNDAPIAAAGNLSTTEDTAGSGSLSVTDVDSAAFTYTVVSGPAHGTLSAFNASTGAYTYTPGANYNGADSFTFKANDGSLDSNVATVGITVSAVNDAPVATGGSGTTAEDTALTGSVSATDVEGSALTYSVVTAPTHGALVLNAGGSYTYTPFANYNGADSFTFKANDGSLDSNVATVNLTVTPVNDAPVATGARRVGEEGSARSGPH